MIIITYFDWSGTREALVRWIETVRSESGTQNVKFMGLYGPSQIKFNWALIQEAPSQQHYHKTWENLTMPAEVTHQVIHYFWPDKSFTRDLPMYPPPHFFEEM